MVIDFLPVYLADSKPTGIRSSRTLPAKDRDLFIAAIVKMSQLMFLWSQRTLTMRLDFEQYKLVLVIEGITEEISLRDLLRFDEEKLVELHMRNFAARVAKEWQLHKTSKAIEEGGDYKQAFAGEYLQTPGIYEDIIYELSGLLQTTHELQGELRPTHWYQPDYFPEQTQVEAVAACRNGDFSQFPNVPEYPIWDTGKPPNFTKQEYQQWEEGYRQTQLTAQGAN